MAHSNKRKAEFQSRPKRPRANYPIASRTNITGPGVWATCDKGREKTAVGELYDLFESLADELWPVDNAEVYDTDHDHDGPDNDSRQGEDLETQIKKEVEGLKKPRVEKRFANCLTGTPCVIFISCKPPVEPVKLVLHHFKQVECTGVTRTKHIFRLTPATDSCVASVPEILVLARKIIPASFASLPDKPDGSRRYRYKIELSFRNHDKIKKADLIPQLAQCVPPDEGHTVDLDHPEIVIFVQVLKSVCGISVMPDYERFKRFNVVQVGEAARRGMDSETKGASE